MSNGSPGYKWWVLVTASIANLTSALDVSIMNISFPRLTEVFNTDASTVVWITVAFSVAELGLLLTMAKIGDTIGRKKVFASGLMVYTVGLILCSISPNITVLILSRIVQGAGAAVILTLGAAIVVQSFPQEQQGQAIGMYAMLSMVGLIAGPALGGVILDVLDWQGIFYTRIPLGIISFVMTLVIIKEQKVGTGRLRLDAGGAVTLLGGTSCLLLYLNLGSDRGFLAAQPLILLAAAVVFIALFIFLERRAAEPVLDLRFFKNRTFSLASVTNFLQVASGGMMPVLMPFYMIDGMLFSSSRAGLIMAVIAVPSLFIAPISGWISDRIGNLIPMIVSTCVFTMAIFLTSRLNINSTEIQMCLIMAMFGTGMGLFTAPNQSATINAAPRRNMATALGVANAMRLLGASVGTAMAGTIYAHQQAAYRTTLMEQGTAASLAEQLSVVNAFQFVILLGVFISVASIVSALMIGKAGDGKVEAEEVG